jgi:nicotinamidase-related amidase
MIFTLKRQRIGFDAAGYRRWETFEEKAEYPARQTALIIVDMWDRHWSEGAARRGIPLAEKINALAMRLREKGSLIVHAASDVMDFYPEHPARKRFLQAEVPALIPEPVAVEDYPLPIDASDGGSDTVDQYAPNTPVWTRQREKIFLDEDRDLICGDEGDRFYANLVSRGVTFLLYAGVHTNMCVLHRSFAIKKMLRRNFKTALIRDLTDAMYNPAKPPYVSHEEGTALVIGFIEKFYSPTIDSGQLMRNE